jgi:hypothetical protein
MAVVQISRITHRSGVSDNLPQLARGEIGLAVDTRKVYIGNGGTNAPTVENLEILTNRSNVIALADSYTYSDAQIGFNAQTGSTATTPITRSIQNKIDDFASVRDFGAIGDGTTDDTAAINRALYELFAREQIERVRRALYFPAGDYLVTSVIKIPSYAKLIGEGPESSTIRSTATTGSVAQLADSLQQVDASVGSNSALRPSHIVVEGLSFEADNDIHSFLVDQAKSCFFTNCSFTGAKTTAPSTVGNVKASVSITSSTTYTTEHINFKNCTLSNQSFGVVMDHDMKSVLFDGCYFHTCYKGIKSGENVTGSAPAVNGPKSVKVTGSIFDNIYSNGVHVYNGNGFVSAFNLYRDVGNNALGSGNATADVVDFSATQACSSVGDCFDRPTADVTTTTRRVDAGSQSTAMDGISLRIGSLVRQAQASVTLDNNSTKSTGATFASNGDNYAVEIEYLVVRSSKYRQGVLRITHDGTAQLLDDDFSENNGSVGVTFSLSNTSNITTLNYTTTSTGAAGTLFFSSRILR